MQTANKLKSYIKIIDFINNGRSIRHVTHWFVDYVFEALSLDFGRGHVGFLEPEVTIFGREANSRAISEERESAKLVSSLR